METSGCVRLHRMLAMFVSMCAVASFPILFSMPAAAPYSCPPDFVYESQEGWVQIGPSILYVNVSMYAHYYHPTRFSCAILHHYMTIHTTPPGQWTLNTMGSDAHVLLTIQEPSWSTIAGLGTWTVQPPYVYITLESGGVGYPNVTWEGVLYWPSPSGYATLSGYGTNAWFSGSFGQSYPVTFILHNNVPFGETHSITLTLTS